ncbi:cytochrome c biogenesis CcdA family protein [Paenibacillus massiliensis]|uniref:cytochrome c biogenesis CcdA family protein n=1 Tax=Paenibacillus massiliensis TaxID=225917 RepID=UPI000376EA7E|nr:cytochrome c biogenesis protein CcdA [Paenibacillus massiliensis]
MPDIHWGIAFTAGLVSALSPCCLPLIPAYLSYISGIPAGNRGQNSLAMEERRVRMLTHAVAFILGFSAVFYSLGASASLFSYWFGQYRDTLRWISAICMILMGLVAMNVLRVHLFMRDYRVSLRIKPVGYVGSLLVGIGFAAGWTPCIGPMLAAIIALAAVEHQQWFWLMTCYVAGFAIPFILLAAYAGSGPRLSGRYGAWAMKLGGGMLVLTGFLLLTDHWAELSILLQRVTPNWLRL